MRRCSCRTTTSSASPLTPSTRTSGRGTNRVPPLIPRGSRDCAAHTTLGFTASSTWSRILRPTSGSRMSSASSRPSTSWTRSAWASSTTTIPSSSIRAGARSTAERASPHVTGVQRTASAMVALQQPTLRAAGVGHRILGTCSVPEPICYTLHMGEPFGWNRAITTSRGDVRVMGGAPLRSAPRIGKKCSGAMKDTSHLGQKDARDKSARGEEMTDGERTQWEVVARALEETGDYRIVRKLHQVERYTESDDEPMQLGMVLDTETTGFDAQVDDVIELGMVLFEYAPATGRVYRIVDAFDELRDPGRHIPAEITVLTHITDDMVQGHRIDAAAVEAFASRATLVISHNAAFDRPFVAVSYTHLRAH